MQEIPSTDRYTDWQLLGKGGMAEVYLVYDRLLKRQVCIKLILPKHTARADLVRRFMREAQAMARLDNPHVLKIFDVGELGDGRPYFTMEYISGGSLQQLIRSFQSRGEPFPVNDALQILGQVARGLQAIHQAEMVHRDLKPANILLRRQSSGETGQPLHAVIADLGIVALEDASRVLTAPGSVIGTVSYMSPEQVSGRMVNAQTDIYACGVILYQLLTDRLPFTGDEMEVMRQHQLVAPPDLQKYRPGLPDLIYRLVAACLQKSPELRLRHSGALLVAIEQARAALAAGGPAALPPSEQSTRAVPWPIMATVAAFLLVIVILGSVIAGGLVAARNGDGDNTVALPLSEGTDQPTPPERQPEPAKDENSPIAVLIVTPTPQPDIPVQETATRTVTPQPTSTSRSSLPTSTPQDLLTNTPIPTFTPVSGGSSGGNLTTINCASNVISPWAASYAATYRDQLGCPLDEARSPEAAYQIFNKGLMVWRADRDVVIVLYYENGTFEEFSVSNIPGNYAGQTDMLKGAFGYIWNTYDYVADRVQNPTYSEANPQDFIIQDFSSGIIFYFLENNANTYILFRQDKSWFTPFD